jgi:hypothetical protein
VLTHQLTKTAYSECDQSALIGTAERGEIHTGQAEGLNCKPLQMVGLGIKKGLMSSSDTGQKQDTPGRARTCDLRIRNPLLYPTELRAL